MPGDTEEEEEKQSKGTEAGAPECEETREEPRPGASRSCPRFSAEPLLSFFPLPSIARVSPDCFQGNGRRPRERLPTRPPRAAMSPAPHWCSERGGTWSEVWGRSMVGGGGGGA